MAKRKKALSKRIPYAKFGLGIAVLLIIAFGIFYISAYLNYGGIKGYQLQHQKFPGAESAELVSGRKNAINELDAINKAVEALDTKPVYASLLIKNQDICFKGMHKNGFAGGTQDNYAYSCGISTEQYYAYTQSRCEIFDVLQKAQGIAAREHCGPNLPNSHLYSKKLNMFGGPLVSLLMYDKTIFLQEKAMDRGATEPCYSGRETVYCDIQQNPFNITDIPSSAQTIVIVKLGATYYHQK